MRDIDLFQLALGLVPPWMVADWVFSRNIQHRWHLRRSGRGTPTSASLTVSSCSSVSAYPSYGPAPAAPPTHTDCHEQT